MSKRKQLERLVGELESGGISRRDFVWRAMGLGLSLSSVGALLSACGGGEKGGQAGEGAAAAGEAELTAYLEREAVGLAAVTAADVATALGDLVSDVDRRALTGGFADYLAGSFRAALSTGVAGWRDDDLAFLAGWGFGLDGFEVPVALWQGDQDRMVPLEHGRWLAAHVPGAAVHLLPGEGHLSLLTRRVGAILADLASVETDNR